MPYVSCVFTVTFIYSLKKEFAMVDVKTEGKDRGEKDDFKAKLDGDGKLCPGAQKSFLIIKFPIWLIAAL